MNGVADAPQGGSMSEQLPSLESILDIIQAHAEEADRRAEEACKRSKYSIQDYHMCTEFAMQRLHDDIARSAGSQRRCPVFPFRARLNEFRRQTILETP